MSVSATETRLESWLCAPLNLHTTHASRDNEKYERLGWAAHGEPAANIAWFVNRMSSSNKWYQAEVRTGHVDKEKQEKSRDLCFSVMENER